MEAVAPRLRRCTVIPVILVSVPVSEDLLFSRQIACTNQCVREEQGCIGGRYIPGYAPESLPGRELRLTNVRAVVPESRRAVPTVDRTVTKGTTAPTTAAPSRPYKPNISVNQARAGGKPPVSAAACHGCLNAHPAKGRERFRVERRHRHRLREGLPVVKGHYP